MEFTRLMSRCPLPYDSDRGAEGRALFSQIAGPTADLLEGTAGCSPYLLGLMQKEAGWLPSALEQAPEDALAGVMAEVRAAADGDLETVLRQGKRRVALLAALADLSGVWPLLEVTGALTDFADLAVDRAMKAALAREIRRGKLPGATEKDLATGAGMVALAMGKMGAGELNYSSDIDLICLFDESRFAPEDYHEARTSFIRATRAMAKMLSDMTAEGYVFRTDLRLRPDPSVTPVCLSMEAAERYYESVGRTWERAAHIKARPCAGDLAAGARYLKMLTPFVWRKHLDFAAIEDAHDMRLRIRDHKGFHGPIVLEGHNMKLGRGGIREIEFFTQTRQIIAGGRDPELRQRETLPALQALAEKGWVPEDVRASLTDHYLFHREVEHRLQMVNDAQTHDLPKSPDGFDRLAAFMGRTDVGALRAEITERLEQVHSLTEGFFAPDAPGAAPAADAISASSEAVVDRWWTYPALRTERAQRIFKRLRPEILRRLARAARPEEAVIHFDGFLKGLPAGVQLFSMFEANPQLIELIVDIATSAPELAQHLGRNSQVLDAVIAGDFFTDWPGLKPLVADLAERLAGLPDYEARLDGARRWQREWHFRIGVHHLRGLIGAEEAGAEYAQLAEATLRALSPHIVAEFARKHGPMPGRGAVVLGMGSLGAARLHSRSDLDLIVIYDAQGVESSAGKRPLATRPYFARLTQAFVTALSAQMAEGRLYEVDMRLRPSGRQGPVATALQSFQNYQENEAWVWEHLALTRARAVAGDAGLAADIDTFRVAFLPRAGADRARVLREVQEMRARLAEAKPAKGAFDAKSGAGRLQDIELTAQTCALLAGSAAQSVRGQLEAGCAAGVLTPAQARDLLAAYHLMWHLQVAGKLLTDGALEPETLGEGGLAFLLRETGQESAVALQASLTAHSERASAVTEAILRLK
ncbi:glutamine-synthetase adenylyltransferase [Pseudoruegeria sp. SHC-113]|uniref:[protein-PII] uridylyltransferase family protein n=1 Tax=Pseudoruegeria sp. SHC-113 TaxID=2855439 RepID=UPI0021BB2C6C|nr:glutamine-synthetase adenylyltransferase [Pseudoruegeria sp. SHC-113]MCT8160760.1 glutamine-synthetase adenylyltransferase [Pseudoruegeria sp. SHC-113]